MTYKVSTWQMRWWVRYIQSLDMYDLIPLDEWAKIVNDDLQKNWNASYTNTEHNRVEFRSQADYEWFLLRWS